MRLKLLGLFLVLVCFGAAAKAATLSLSWTYDFVANPACSATVTKSCVSGFEYGTTADLGKSLIKIGQFGTSGTIQSFTQTFPYGTTVFYLRTIALDSNGVTVYSTPTLAAPVSITVSPVKTFSVTITAQ